MSPKSSTFINETRSRETWLGPTAEKERAESGQEADGREVEQLLATAALVRGALTSVQVPEDAEERSRKRALAVLEEVKRNGATAPHVRAPWYLRLGHFMRFVFTLGRRR